MRRTYSAGPATVLSRILNILTTLITVGVVVIAAGSILIRLLGWNLFAVSSPSMSPTYPVDTLVVVQRVDPAGLQVGDVITYTMGSGVLVTHRITAIDPAERSVTTRGDANRVDDKPVPWDSIVGRVILGIPELGRPLRQLTAPENRPVVLVCIAGLFAVSLLWDVLARRQARRRAAEVK